MDILRPRSRGAGVFIRLKRLPVPADSTSVWCRCQSAIASEIWRAGAAVGCGAGGNWRVPAVSASATPRTGGDGHSGDAVPRRILVRASDHAGVRCDAVGGALLAVAAASGKRRARAAGADRVNALVVR